MGITRVASKNFVRGNTNDGPLPPPPVVNAFPVLSDLQQHRYLGNAGGFSGAALWSLQASERWFCLRQWPEHHPDPERLARLHSLLLHVVREGFSLVPVPLVTRTGGTWWSSEGRLWELTPWLPGKADFREAPSSRKLAAALQALARFHQAAGSFQQPVLSPSPAIRSRAEQLARFARRDLPLLPHAMERVRNAWPEFFRRADQLLDQLLPHLSDVERELLSWQDRPLPLQYVLRDIWHDHVLFENSEVSGIVDFGAVRVEARSGDIARLLGSLVGNDQRGWSAGLEAYESVQPLTEVERQLIAVFDRSGLLLAGISWLVWIALEGRRFEDPSRVLSRMDDILLRLEDSGPNGAPLTLFDLGR